jgi:hypothetical protein
MGNLSRACIVGALLVVTGCGSIELSTSPGRVGEPVSLVRLRSEPFSFSYNSGFRESARIVVRDAAQWSTVWAQVHEGGTVPARPVVDFSREMIVLVALGSRNSGGFGILIEDAAESGLNGVSISVLSIAPGAQCIVTGALTQPVDIARLPRRDGTVRFIERTQTRECT